jgi:hypothetical protein
MRCMSRSVSGLYSAALHAGPHGGIGHGQRARAQRAAGFTAAAAAGQVFDSTHGRNLLDMDLYRPVRCGDSMAYLFPTRVSFFTRSRAVFHLPPLNVLNSGVLQGRPRPVVRKLGQATCPRYAL